MRLVVSKRNQIHVYARDDVWVSKKSGSDRTLSICDSKSEAIGYAVYHAKRDGNTEVIVHFSLNG